MNAKLAATILLATIAGCVPVTETSIKPDAQALPTLQMIWNRAVTFVPPAPNTKEITIGAMSNSEIQNALNTATQAGQTYPVIVYLHGCTGQEMDTWNVGQRYAKQGYVVISPDSFDRPNRKPTCGKKAYENDPTMRHRKEELRYTRTKLQDKKWVRQSHVYMMGHSEGAAAVFWASGTHFRARIALSVSCGGVYSGTIRGPRTQPALALLANNDAVYTARNKRINKCKVNPIVA